MLEFCEKDPELLASFLAAIVKTLFVFWAVSAFKGGDIRWTENRGLGLSAELAWSASDFYFIALPWYDDLFSSLFWELEPDSFWSEDEVYDFITLMIIFSVSSEEFAWFFSCGDDCPSWEFVLESSLGSGKRPGLLISTLGGASCELLFLLLRSAAAMILLSCIRRQYGLVLVLSASLREIVVEPAKGRLAYYRFLSV